MNKLSVDKRDQTKYDFLRENFWWEVVVPELDSWVAFYFKHGRFPGLQKLISIPKISLPYFLKTDMPISPANLYKKFQNRRQRSDAKGLVSIHALAALNIHFGGNKYISQSPLNECMFLSCHVRVSESIHTL